MELIDDYGDSQSVFIGNPMLNVPLVSDEKDLTIVERKLCRFFRCCFFQEKCYFVSNVYSSYLLHLETSHSNQPLLCTYCYDEDKLEETFFKPLDLIDHLLYQHGFRRYQCNSCMYRAPTKNHVHVHQAAHHGEAFTLTIKGHIFPEMTKVIRCDPVIYGPQPDVTVFWKAIRSEREDDGNYQCLYCNFSAPLMHVVFSHVTANHCDNDLCIYDKYHDAVKEAQEIPNGEDEDPATNREENTSNNNNGHQINAGISYDLDYEPREEPLPSPQNDILDSEPLDLNGLDTSKDNQTSPKGGKRIAPPVEAKRSVAKKKTGTNLAIKITTPPISEESGSDNEREFIPLKNVGFISGQYVTQLTAFGKQRNVFKCTICNNNEPIKQVNIESHVRQVHNTLNTFRCSECLFIGSKNSINEHIRESEHKNAGYEKFIVNFNEPSTSTDSHQYGPQAPIPGGSGIKKTKKDAKKKKVLKNLSGKIKDSTFVGPKNWTQKPIPSDQPNTSVHDDLRMSSDEEDENSKDYLDSSEDEVQATKVNQENNDEDEDFVVEPLQAKDRGSNIYFCLFCDENWTNLKSAFSHMRKHLGITIKCPDCPFMAGTRDELEGHTLIHHKNKALQLPFDPPNTAAVDNYITEFLNQQFNYRRHKNNMGEDEDSNPIYVLCPLCEKANKILGENNYHFTNLTLFKKHFWKHAAAFRVVCTLCGGLVARTGKKRHLQEQHEDCEDPKELYSDSMQFVSGQLKNIKSRIKTKYYDRMKLAHGITKIPVILVVDYYKKAVKSETTDDDPMEPSQN